jgi:large subunit ribosomal protein L2
LGIYRGELNYIAPRVGLVKNISGDDVAPEIGNALPRRICLLSTNVHNIEINQDRGGKISKACIARNRNKEDRYAILKMPSGELRKVLVSC